MRHVSYAPKLVINADSTKVILYGDNYHYFYDLDGNLLRTQGQFYTNSKDGEWSWHPTDPDKALVFYGTNLQEYTYSTDSRSTIVDWGGTPWMGGTTEMCDQSGSYYSAVQGGSSGSLRFYDRTEGVFYTNEPSVSGVDYIMIAPNGSGVAVAHGLNTTWYGVNHATNSWGASTWLCNYSPHGDLITDSNGTTWFVCFGNSITQIGSVTGLGSPVIYKIPVTNPDGYGVIFNQNNWGLDGHISANINGTNRDWFSINLNYNNDPYTDATPWDPWGPYWNENLLVNVLTGAIRRLCHNRSRNVDDSHYSSFPKASLSVDGKYVIYNSNGGRVTGSYVDGYAVTTGFDVGQQYLMLQGITILGGRIQ